MANCSSSATGAVWWKTPTARSSCRLTHGVGHETLLADEGQDLQLDGEVDLADVDPLGRGKRHGREVQDAAHPGRGQAVADRLGDLAGVVRTPMEACVATTTSSSSSIGRTVSPPIR